MRKIFLINEDTIGGTIGYHGSKSDFDSFSNSKLGYGNDENGAGFYFFKDKKEAYSYAEDGFIYKCKLLLKKEISLSNQTISDKLINTLLNKAPDKDYFYNWSENIQQGKILFKQNILNNAESDYDILQDIWGDLYKDEPEHSQLFCKILHEYNYGGFEMNYHGVVRYICFDESRIKILEKIKV